MLIEARTQEDGEVLIFPFYLSKLTRIVHMLMNTGECREEFATFEDVVSLVIFPLLPRADGHFVIKEVIHILCTQQDLSRHKEQTICTIIVLHSSHVGTSASNSVIIAIQLFRYGSSEFSELLP